MGVNAASQGGEGEIDLFEVTSNYTGEAVDLSSGVNELKIYESVLDTTVRVVVNYIDSGYGQEKANSEDPFNNSAGEKTELVVKQFKNGKIQKLLFKGDYELRVDNNARESYGGATTTETSVTTWFTSKESLDNNDIEKRVVKKYERKISDNVFRILKEVLGTRKSVFVDDSLNDFNFLGKNEKPFYKINWLCKRTVPEGIGDLGILAGYLFYETARGTDGTEGGFHFKSVDKLFSNPPVKSYIMSNTNEVPLGYDDKIINHIENSSVDLTRNMLSGALFQNELETFEPFSNAYEKEDFDYSSQNLGSNNGGKEFWKLASDLNFQEKVTKYSSRFFDTGTLPTGSKWSEQKKESKETNFDLKEILRQATNRYNQMDTIDMTIIITMDFSLHVGDMIQVDFPQIGSAKAQRPAKNKSGKYMIMDLCHRITSTGCWSSLHLVRDSIYK